jgi:Ni/Fe-hydrogenase subunit HybB-like protein
MQSTNSLKPSGDPIPSMPVIAPGQTYESVTEKISSIVLTPKIRLGWLAGLAISFGMMMMMLFSITMLFMYGVGVWGVNIPIGWGFAIVNFVWWIGIGHAGTLISAILLLFRQEWRTSINRFAEAMTLFAVACAGLFPILHLGRPWLFYWLIPYPNTMALWPQFRSPLVWDVFALTTYATVSLLFWYIGLVPDLATLRDRAKNKLVRLAYGLFALGWRNSARHWHRYQTTYLLLAALATPLVVSVHSVVSFDFAVGIIPGWHVTLFPPYFVAGAIFSGFAMVLTLVIPLRKFYGLEGLITMRHLNNMAKVMLATGLIVVYGYVMEAFHAWYSAVEFERYMIVNRMTGPYAPFYWALILCNALVPQALWSKRVRANPLVLFVIAIIVNIGMWLERFIIIITSLTRDFLPSSWDMYYPTVWDVTLLFGTIGLFLTMLFLFLRVLPAISIFEVRELLHGSHAAQETEGKA